MTVSNRQAEAKARPLYRRRWMIVSLSLILLFAVTLVLLPVGMGYGLKKWLLDNGAERVTLQDVDFNPFSGRLTLRGLQVSRAGKPALALPSLTLVMDWAPLWDRRVQIKLLQVTGLKLDIENSTKGMQVGGISLPDGQQGPEAESVQGEPWGIGLESLLVADSGLTYRDSNFETRAGIKRLTLGQLASWLPQQPALVGFEGSIAEAQARLDGKLLAFAAEPGFTGRLVLDGLALETFAPLAEQQLKTLQGRLSIASAIEVKQLRGGDIALLQEGRLSLRELKAALAAGGFDVQQAAWDGRTQLDLPAAGQSINLKLNGRFEQAEAMMETQDGGMSLQHQGLAWNGELSVGLETESTRLDGSGELRDKGLTMSLAAEQDAMRLQHQGLTWKGKLGVDLKSQSTRIEAKGELQNAGLEMSLAAEQDGMRLQHQGLTWKGDLGVDLEPQSTRIEAKGELHNEGLEMSLAAEQDGMRLQHQGLTWKGDLGADLKSQSTRIDAKGELHNEGLVMSLPDVDAAISNGIAHWSGKLRLDDSAERMQLESDGELTLEKSRIDYSSDFLDLERMALTSDRLKLDQQKATGGVELGHAGRLSVDQLRAQLRGDLLSQQRLQWQGDLAFRSAAEDLRIDSDGGLNGKGLSLALPRRDLLLQQDAVDWQGKFGYGMAGQEMALSADGALTFASLLLEAPEHKSSLLSFELMKIDGIDVQSLDSVNVAEVSTSNLLLSRRGDEAQDADTELPALLATARSSLSNIRFDRQVGLSVDLLEHENLQMVIRRFADGQVNIIGVIDLLVELMAGDQQAQPAAVAGTDSAPPVTTVQASPAQPKQETAALPVRVAKVALVGDSKLIFIDENVSPTYRSSMVFRQFEVTDIDSSDPDKDSPVQLKVGIGEDTELDLQGKARFFDKKVTADLNGRIDGLALPPLSPYIAPALGYRINSGSLDADIALQIKQGKLGGSNQLSIYHLEVQELTAEEKKRYQVQSTLPLETGLAMLRGDDGTIKLKLPISGDINKPEFGIADAINKAMAKAMQKGARVYLAAALFPFGTMVAVAEIAGKSAMEISLDPIAFAPASSELDSKAGEYLEKLAKVLQERPAVHMKICGVAVPADREALLEKAATAVQKLAPEALETQASKTDAGQGELTAEQEPAPAAVTPPAPQVNDQQLIALATQRGAAVKSRLRKQFGIKAGRLVVCDGKIGEATKQAGPRVDLFL